MAEDLEYPFSDDDEDTLLNRAYDRWEQLGGAAARGPLFQFTMQPMGRRRRWREVVITRFKTTYTICIDQWELFKIEINVALVTRLVGLKGTFSLCVCVQ